MTAEMASRAPAYAPAPSTARPRTTVASLHVIYDADGTRTGELVYMAKKLLGIAHCAACDITHGPRREKPEFTALKASGWGVPVHNIHRDEMDAPMAAAVAGVLPCVVARTAAADLLLLRPAQLEACEGDVVAFEKAVNHAVHGLGLFVPPPVPVCDIPRIPHDPVQRRKPADPRDDESELSEDAVVPAQTY